MSQSSALQLDGAKEFISKVQEAEKIYQEICVDLSKYRFIRIKFNYGSVTKRFLNITPCDVEHLSLRPIDDEVEKYKWAPKYTMIIPLPRALSLRYNVCLSYAYDKNILMQLAASKELAAKWGKEDFLEVLKVLKEWITSKKMAYKVLHEFAYEMESIRPHFIRGKHVLSRRCVKVFDLERTWLEKRLNPENHRTSEELLELMCRGCRNFELKSDELMNQLALHFRTFLREYYSNPEVAEEQSNFIDAVQQCKHILQNYLLFKININSFDIDPKSTWATKDFYGFNKTMYSMYDPSKYPDDKGLYLFLTLSFEKLVDRCEQEMCEADCIAPQNDSVVQHALNYNLAEFDAL